MIKVAFGSVPKDGGTFTFYRNMRPALLEKGIDLRCVSLGVDQHSLTESAYIDEGCVLLAPKTTNVKKQAQTFADWCSKEAVDIVLGINSEAILSSLHHLPEAVRCMARCANSFDHGYRITLSGIERLALIIAQTPRQLKDLSEHYNAPTDKIVVIPNGIDPAQFRKRSARIRDDPSAPLCLTFAGRLEHRQKGVLFLPEILQNLKQSKIPFSLKIAGKGAHEAQLKSELNVFVTNGSVEFLGSLPPKKLNKLLSKTEIYLFTSQFEGCPNALIEAMMAGCVPISWKLDGITDFIIQDQKNGYLSEKGNNSTFANHISSFYRAPDQLELFSKSAHTTAVERFNSTIAAEAYANAFKSVMNAPPPTWKPKSWNSFQVDPNFPRSWKSHLPYKLRTFLKRNRNKLQRM